MVHTLLFLTKFLGERYIGRQKREAPSLGQRVFSFFGGLFGYGSEDNSEFEKQHFLTVVFMVVSTNLSLWSSC